MFRGTCAANWLVASSHLTELTQNETKHNWRTIPANGRHSQRRAIASGSTRRHRQTSTSQRQQVPPLAGRSSLRLTESAALRVNIRRVVHSTPGGRLLPWWALVMALADKHALRTVETLNIRLLIHHPFTLRPCRCPRWPARQLALRRTLWGMGSKGVSRIGRSARRQTRLGAHNRQQTHTGRHKFMQLSLALIVSYRWCPLFMAAPQWGA